MGVFRSIAVAFSAVLVVCSVFFFVGCDDSDDNVVGTDKLYLFSTTLDYDGDLGGRAGADAICLADANMPTDATVAHAFISVTDDDCIANMPLNYNFPENVPIVAPDGVTVIADNWGDLLDGTIKVTLNDAGILGAGKGNEWWSGSDQDGTLNADNCSGWTENGGATSGMKGFPDNLDSDWVTYFPSNSNFKYYIIGIAY